MCECCMNMADEEEQQEEQLAELADDEPAKA